MLRKFAVLLRLSSNFQGSQPFDCKRWAKNKIGHFIQKKIKFRTKKRRKNGFFKVFRQGSKKTLREFDVLLRLRSNLQGSRSFVCTRCADIKIGLFSQKKNKFWTKKSSKKRVFQGFPTRLQESASGNLLYCSG